MDKKLKISSGTRVAVMGLGVSGWAAVRYALHQKAEVFISDKFLSISLSEANFIKLLNRSLSMLNLFLNSTASGY